MINGMYTTKEAAQYCGLSVMRIQQAAINYGFNRKDTGLWETLLTQEEVDYIMSRKGKSGRKIDR